MKYVIYGYLHVSNNYRILITFPLPAASLFEKSKPRRDDSLSTSTNTSSPTPTASDSNYSLEGATALSANQRSYSSSAVSQKSATNQNKPYNPFDEDEEEDTKLPNGDARTPLNPFDDDIENDQLSSLNPFDAVEKVSSNSVNSVTVCDKTSQSSSHSSHSASKSLIKTTPNDSNADLEKKNNLRNSSVAVEKTTAVSAKKKTKALAGFLPSTLESSRSPTKDQTSTKSTTVANNVPSIGLPQACSTPQKSSQPSNELDPRSVCLFVLWVQHCAKQN